MNPLITVYFILVSDHDVFLKGLNLSCVERNTNCFLHYIKMLNMHLENIILENLIQHPLRQW